MQFNVNGAGFKGFTVPARPEGVFAGVWHAGKLWQVDMTALRAKLPYRWRKAFDRAGSFWYPSSPLFDDCGDDPAKIEAPQAHIVLHDRRGRYLTTIYANGEVA